MGIPIHQQINGLLDQMEEERERAYKSGNARASRLWYTAITDLLQTQLRALQAAKAANDTESEG